MICKLFTPRARGEKESVMTVLELLYLILVSYKCIAIDIDDIALPGCRNYSNCDDATDTDVDTPSFSTSQNPVTLVLAKGETNISPFTNEYTKDNNKITPTSQTTVRMPASTTKPATGTTIKNDIKPKTSFVTKNHSPICMCDITIASCDINCCCDIDCNDFQLSVFSHCDNHRPKMYDSRYCYTKNFIQRNNTKFILERLASNLFCIAYDNLPPIYGVSEVPNLTNRKAFEQSKRTADLSESTWEWHNLVVPEEFNSSSWYHDTDVLWKFQANYVNKIELPQTGLNSKCTFKKTLKYLESFKSMCMQTDLSDGNSYLFTEAYQNFTVITSPHSFNGSYGTADHICPTNICIPVQTLYCTESRTDCNSTRPSENSCSNSNCRNVVKRLHYKIVHNGTIGIQSIEARFELANVSQHFYQYFEVTYEWPDEDRRYVLPRSDLPGYIVEKPISTGLLITNTTNNVKNEHIKISRSNYYLTTPVRRKNGDCDSRARYVVGFGEDIVLTCNIRLKTKDFSSDVCVDLQNQTFKLLLEDSLHNVSEINGYKTFVSKSGVISTNETSNWIQILLDRIPQNVVTGQIYNDRIRCSGLVTSLHLEILHTIMPKLEDATNYKIAGVAATFAEPIDISWPKCHESNCTDVLRIEIFTFVTFTDISTPSMYYYAGGPNLDISLPYDFFYPFMSGAGNIAEPSMFVLAVYSGALSYLFICVIDIDVSRF